MPKRGGGEPRAGGGAVARRVAGLDWERIGADLESRGHARIPRLLSAAECRHLAALWDGSDVFRTRISLERHGFGAGEYRYFAYPLPPRVAALRAALYPPLARIAGGWLAALGAQQRLPATLKGFLARCRAHGQRRPTPLLLRYTGGGYNRLHQDLYGEVAFPLQLACLLSHPGRDFTGGEFLLVEQRPRMQSRGDALALEAGEGIVFATRERPVQGARGIYRAQLRHGVSTVRTGERLTLGIIFHDAR